MSSTCRRFALHDAGGLQRMGEGAFAGTRGNDKVSPIPAIRGGTVEPPESTEKQTSIVPCEAAVLVFRKKLPLAALRALVHGMEGDLPETEHYRWPERTLLPRKTRRAHNQRAAKTTPCKIAV